MKNLQNIRKSLLLSVLTAIFAMSLSALLILGFANRSTFMANAAETGIASMNVSLGEDIVVKYYTDATLDDGSYLEVAFNDNVVEVKQHENGVFAFNGVAPHHMNDDITATLKDASGNAIGESYTSSIQAYVNELLSYDSYSACPESFGLTSELKYKAMRELAVDFLNYGAAAQTYKNEAIDDLANADIDQSLATQALTVSESDKVVNGDMWVGAGVRFDYKLGLYFVFKAESLSGITAYVEGEEVTPAVYDESQNWYVIRYNGFNATNMNSVITATLKKDGLADQTFAYSVASYVYAKGGADTDLAALVNATYAYGYAAVAYSNADYLVPTFDVAGYSKITDAMGYDYSGTAYQTVDFPALNLTDYTAKTTYTGGDKTPTVTTKFTLNANSAYVFPVISSDLLDVSGDDTVLISRYELDKLNTDNVTVTYDEEKGYTYHAETTETVDHLVAYGTTLTITGEVNVDTATRVNVNNHLVIGTDEVAGNVKVERTATDEDKNRVFGLYNGGDLTVKNGTLTTVSLTSGTGVLMANGTDSVITVEEKGTLDLQGGTYAIYSGTSYSSRVVVEGTITTDKRIHLQNNAATVVEGDADIYGCGFIPGFYVGEKGNVTFAGQSTFVNLLVDGTLTSNSGLTYIDRVNVLSDAGEYGFIPGIYVRKGTASFADRLYANGIQVGSEKENASGTLTIIATDKDAMYGNNISNKDDNVRWVFAKGVINLTNATANKRTAMNMGTFDGARTVLDIKSGVTLNAQNFEHLMGAWTKSTVQQWMIEEGATINLSRSSGTMSFATISGSANIRVVSYKTAQMNIDGEVKTVRVANVSASTVASPSALVYPTVDATTAWTTDTSTEAVGDFSAATDGTNTVYYQVIA